MRDTNVKNALRHRKDTVGSFDELIRLVRLAEQEAAEDASRFPARTSGKRVTGNAYVQSTQDVQEASRPAEKDRQNESPAKPDLRGMQETISRLTARLEELEKEKRTKERESSVGSQTGERPKQRRKIVCYKCGKEGHVAAGCRNPPTQAWIDRQKQSQEPLN